MGFIHKLISKGPGGPAKTAESLIKSFNVCMTIHNGISEQQGYNAILTSRYGTIKKMNRREIEFCSNTAKSIGDIIVFAIYAENPPSFSSDFYPHTIDELAKTYVKWAPQELESLSRIPTILKNLIIYKDSSYNYPSQYEENKPLAIDHLSSHEGMINAICEDDEESFIFYSLPFIIKEFNVQSAEKYCSMLFNYLSEGEADKAIPLFAKMFISPSNYQVAWRDVWAFVDMVTTGNDDEATTMLEKIMFNYFEIKP